MTPAKIITQHPDPSKKGVNIEQDKYDLAYGAILDILLREKVMQPMPLYDRVAQEISDHIEGSAKWYAVTVKLDMEARGILQHDRQQRAIRLVQES